MVYGYNLKGNKKGMLVYVISALCVGVGISTFFFASRTVALICMLVGIYVAYVMMKNLGKIKSSRIETYDDGLTVYMANGTESRFRWKDITHSGLVTEGNQKGSIFIYNEKEDRVIQLPPVFEQFDDFIGELREKTPFVEYELEEEETMLERLKKILGVNEEKKADNSEVFGAVAVTQDNSGDEEKEEKPVEE